MSSRLKNAGATYQKLVDMAFKSKIERNLEAYVDDMAIKSNDNKVLISDITETFDNLQRINMKLNPKKSDMKSPRTLKEMQSLSGELAALNRRTSSISPNNEARHEALLAGLCVAARIKVQSIDVKVDSKLVASQINGSYVVNNTSMIKYLATAKEYIASFKNFAILNILRNLNQKADILSKLAMEAFDYLTKELLVEVLSE
uniref:Reverse transcriptase domain-containing protein n=1 Tax=Tanacetum cinerariifolium TaxID=118510 RepID=A0A6L2KBW5_TANCI|nr:reverse transcriptase domain-containing protein [Tanacetum cinerariifolium]